MTQEGIIATLVGTFFAGGTGATLLTLLFTRPKTKAEADNIRAQIEITMDKATLEMVQSLRAEVDRLSKRLVESDREISWLRAEVEKCQKKHV